MTETNKSAFLTKSRIRNEQYETYKIKLLKTKNQHNKYTQQQQHHIYKQESTHKSLNDI